MIGWLYRILIGHFSSCDHTWITISQNELIGCDTKLPKGFFYVLKCTKCGEIHSKRILINTP